MSKLIYIAGPMSTYPLYNFPAFDECRDALRTQGYEVISPADLDRSVGFDPASSIATKGFLDEAMQRDIEAIMRVDCMVMLPGWRGSTGARAEYALARWRHIPVFQWPEMVELHEGLAYQPGKALLGASGAIMDCVRQSDPANDFLAASMEESAGGNLGGIPGGMTEHPKAKLIWKEVIDEMREKIECTAATDPKAQAGSKKCPMVLLPPVALEDVAWVHKLGADKYGAYNWRYTGISSATYISAIMRHLMAIAKGEWLDPESGRPHAAHIACSCNILMDADQHGKLDR
jgi:hypothetical protein